MQNLLFKTCSAGLP